MKLRRAMAVAAATAVIAPATFLAAPAAYATISNTPIASETNTDDPGADDPEAEKPAATNPDTPDTKVPDSTTQDAEGEKPATTPDDTTEGEESDTATEDDTKDGDKPDTATEDDTKEGDKPETETPDTETPDTEDPDEQFPACEEARIDVSLGGFPNKIVAGSGWKNFTFDVKNTGKENIERLDVFTIATYGDSPEDFDDRLIEKYAHFEYKNAETGEWVDELAGTGINNGFFYGEFALDAGQKVSIDLRVKIDKGAPAGDGVAIAVGGYDNGAEDETFMCFENGAVYPFTIVKAGGNAGDVDDSEPTGEKPKSNVKPQGQAKPIPVTGNLAETGSDSSLPVIGAVGGVAILAGAGAVFAMKRRRGDATA